MPRFLWTPEMDEVVARAHPSQIRRVAEQLGLTVKQVIARRYAIRRAGGLTARKWSDAAIADIRRRRRNGETLKSIAARYGVPRSTLRGLCARTGIGAARRPPPKPADPVWPAWAVFTDDPEASLPDPTPLPPRPVEVRMSSTLADCAPLGSVRDFASDKPPRRRR